MIFLILLIVIQSVIIYELYHYSYKPFKEQKTIKIKSIEDLDIETQKEYLSYLEALKQGKKIIINGVIFEYIKDTLFSKAPNFISSRETNLKDFEQSFIKSLNFSKESLLLDNAIEKHKTRLQNYENLIQELKNSNN